jgi:hypothetical protein
MMKKILLPVVAVAAFATLAFAGENFFHSVKAEFGAFATRLGVGVTEANPSYVLDVVGPSRVVGAVTMTGAPAVTGAASVVGSVAVSTAADSSVRMAIKGAVVTLSTRNVTMGDLFYQTSDNKVYVATRTWGENVDSCPTTACYVALN